MDINVSRARPAIVNSVSNADRVSLFLETLESSVWIVSLH